MFNNIFRNINFLSFEGILTFRFLIKTLFTISEKSVNYFKGVPEMVFF